MWPSYLAYVVTFLFIGQVWANHHVMRGHPRLASRGALLLIGSGLSAGDGR
jgi:uncharacterized membrane protein